MTMCARLLWHCVLAGLLVVMGDQPCTYVGIGGACVWATSKNFVFFVQYALFAGGL